MHKAAAGLAGAVCAVGLVVGTAAPVTAAHTPGSRHGGPGNQQNGLVNVNLQKLNLQVPASVAVPVGVAANVCNVSVLSQANLSNCTAKSNTWALSWAIANAMAGTDPGWNTIGTSAAQSGSGGAQSNASNTQNGLVNVNVQDLKLQVPVSVAVPVGVAANVCNISILSALSAGQCTATSNSQALSYSVANDLARQGPQGGPGNHQNGLVNVNVQGLNLKIPVSVAVPVSVAANVCGISVASAGTLSSCTAKSNSQALSQAIADAMTGAANGKAGAAPAKGGPANDQHGLVNVNVQSLGLQVPVAVALPVNAAANVCNVSVASVGLLGTCNAQGSSAALSQALARALAAQTGH